MTSERQQETTPSGESRGIEFTPTLEINAPEWFGNRDFIAAIEGNNGVATWHLRGTQPGEYSDVFLFVDPGLGGEGSEMGVFPSDIWDAIIAACRNETVLKSRAGIPAQPHIMVRITNL